MFKGRIDRIGYLLGSLYVFLPLLAVIMLYGVINLIFTSTGVTDGVTGVIRSLMNFTLYLVGIVSILLLIPVSIGVQIRRWHDIGQSGWLTLLSYVPFVGWLFTLLLLFIPGKNEGNPYGAPASPRSIMPVLFGERTTPTAKIKSGPSAFGAGKMGK